MSRPRDWSPLRESDPVGGDPTEITRLAERYANTATAINAAAEALRTIHDSETVWESDAGRAFRDRTLDTAGTVQKAFRRYEQTAAALEAYARILRQVQECADGALQQARLAQAEKEAAERAIRRNAELPVPDPAMELRLGEDVRLAENRITRAAGDAEKAEQDWRTAGSRAADAIDDVISEDGLSNSWWDDTLDVVSAITAVMGRLSAVFGMLALVFSLVPFLQPFAAVFGALALGTGLLSLLGNSLLYANGRATLGDVIWDLVGVVSFGAGRAFTLAGRSMATGARGLAKPAFVRSLRQAGHSSRQARRIARAQGITGGGRAAKTSAARAGSPSGLWPTRSEWVDAYRPQNIYKDIVSGPSPALPGGTESLPEVAAALRRSAIAARTATTAGALGGVAAGRTLGIWASGSDQTPVERTP